jgi:hypothetical protein
MTLSSLILRQAAAHAVIISALMTTCWYSVTIYFYNTGYPITAGMLYLVVFLYFMSIVERRRQMFIEFINQLMVITENINKIKKN